MQNSSRLQICSANSTKIKANPSAGAGFYLNPHVNAVRNNTKVLPSIHLDLSQRKIDFDTEDFATLT